MVLDRGKIISISKKMAIVQIGSEKKRCEIRKGTKVRKGDEVVVAFGVVVDKI